MKLPFIRTPSVQSLSFPPSLPLIFVGYFKLSRWFSILLCVRYRIHPDSFFPSTPQWWFLGALAHLVLSMVFRFVVHLLFISCFPVCVWFFFFLLGVMGISSYGSSVFVGVFPPPSETRIDSLTMPYITAWVCWLCVSCFCTRSLPPAKGGWIFLLAHTELQRQSLVFFDPVRRERICSLTHSPFSWKKHRLFVALI